MRFFVAASAALWGVAQAFDCSAAQVGWLDETTVFETTVDSPPSTTKLQFSFNPCSPVRAENCKPDDHLCGVEWVVTNKDSVLSAVKSYGSAAEGAEEATAIGDGSISFVYTRARWGSETLSATVKVECGEQRGYRISTESNSVEVTATHPDACALRADPQDGGDNGDDDDDDDDEDEGWGLFTWIFVLSLLAGLAYALLTVYINFAQSRGTLPLAANVGDVLRDLPYLLRDIARRVKRSFSTRSSTSGYAAL